MKSHLATSTFYLSLNLVTSTSSLALRELASDGPTARRCSKKASPPCVDPPGDAATGDSLADATPDAIRLGKGLL